VNVELAAGGRSEQRALRQFHAEIAEGERLAESFSDQPPVDAGPSGRHMDRKERGITSVTPA
jgi:hypothetical protein